MNIVVSVNRTSLKAGRGVIFNASATTDGSTSDPFHDLLFIWNFDDPDSGTFTNGRGSVSKNAAYGPIVAHVYESAGTYNPTLRVYNGDRAYAGTVSAITVTDWANDSNTICVSNTGPAGDFTGAPSNATQTYIAAAADDFDTALALLASGKRLMFRAGESWSSAAAGVLSGTIASPDIDRFGAGADPIVTAATAHNVISITSAGVTDLRVANLDITGTGAKAIAIADSITVQQVTAFQLTIHDSGAPVLTVGGGVVDQLIMYECTCGPYLD